MSEFIRKPDSDNIFENTENSNIIILRHHSELESRYNNNDSNKFDFNDIKSFLENENTCYWQKQREFERINKRTGKKEKITSHKIIIPYQGDIAIEIIISLFEKPIDTFNKEFSYKIAKFREIFFVKAPTNNVIITNTSFTFKSFELPGDKSFNDGFQEIYKKIQELDLPTKDINKETDKKIWDNYVVALKRIIKKREQVWKINKVSQPYEREYGNKRNVFIDIKINESDLIKQFEKNILDEIGKKKLEDWGVNKNEAFFELRNYSLLSNITLENIKAIGNEFFYELDEDSPFHYIRGEINFKYSDENLKTEIYENIEEKLAEFQINKTFNENGEIDISESDYKYLEKIISDDFSEITQIKKDTEIQLKIDFIERYKIIALKNEVREKLTDKGYNPLRFDVSFNEEEKLLSVKIGAYLEEDIFSSLKLPLQKISYKIKPKGINQLKQVDNIEINNGFYEFTLFSTSSLYKKINEICRANKIKQKYTDFIKRPTTYHYKYSNIELLKDFKLQVEENKRKFDIASSILTLNPTSKKDYEQQLKKFEDLPFNIKIEKKSFKPKYFVQFIDDIESKRKSILNRIQNKIRKDSNIKINTEIVKGFKKLIFDFQFDTDELREIEKERIISIQKEFEHLTSIKFENELGRTVYEFVKNEELEEKKEKELVKGIKQATFVFLTEEEKQRYDKEKEKRGDDDRFREGQNIGKLLKKQNNKLTFLLDETFESLLFASKENRIEKGELKKGYIKPIFPGDLTNIGRMISAMKKVTEPGQRYGYPANQNLPNFIFDSREARENNEDIDGIKERILNSLIESNLNEKQIEAVAKSLAAIDLALIQGPPGTGKTTVIAEIIWQTLRENPQAKILITSQTNLAVDNAIERLTGKQIVRPLRIGNIDKFENEGKIFSVERIDSWINSNNKEQEKKNSNNAIEHWIDLVSENSSKDKKYQKSVSKWKERLKAKTPDIKEAFYTTYTKHINIFAATCSECGSWRFKNKYNEVFNYDTDNNRNIEFDLVIMDEASKATPPELILPLTLGKKVIIIGDHKQLPPMLDEKDFSEALESVGLKDLIETWTREDYKISQFEKLFKIASKNIVASLDTQYRMHEQIMQCITQFYKDQEEFENGLLCGITETMDIPDFSEKGSRWHGIETEPFINPNIHAIWVNVSSPENTIGTGTSYKNEGEIEAIKTILKILTKAKGFEAYYKSRIKEESKEIGIITFYMPQMQEIKKAIYPDLTKTQLRKFEANKYKNAYNVPFRINTVDRFQGMEREILIISTVRSDKQKYEKNGKELIRYNKNYPYALGFAREIQRINVGFSRAKRLLIVVGNQKHFETRTEYAEAIRKMHKVDIKQLENLV